MTLAVESLGLTRRLHGRDLPTQLGHALADPAPVQFDLGLTGTTATDALTRGRTATGLPGQRLTPTTQTREHVFELRQLHLRLALLGLGVLGEDVQDETRAVNDLDLHDVLEGTTLRGRELGIHDDGVRTGRGHHVLEFQGLARAEVRAGVRGHAPLQQTVHDLGTGGLRERRELTQRVLRIGQGPAREQTRQADALEPQLPVLDLGDVLELGGQPGDTAQRVTFGEVLLIAVGFDVDVVLVRELTGAAQVIVSATRGIRRVVVAGAVDAPFIVEDVLTGVVDVGGFGACARTGQDTRDDVLQFRSGQFRGVSGLLRSGILVLVRLRHISLIYGWRRLTKSSAGH